MMPFPLLFYLSLPSTPDLWPCGSPKLSNILPRFIDILPFDSTRVVLAQVPGVLDSHYINASFIDSFDEPQVGV